MNKQNQLRHSVSMVKKYLNNPNEERLWEVFNCMTDYCNSDNHCIKCDYEDIGYCGLRLSNISDYDRITKFCFPSFLKYVEHRYNIKL